MSKIDSRGGGQHFSNKSKIQKSLKYLIGGGGQGYFGKTPKFSRFLIMRSPRREVFKRKQERVALQERKETIFLQLIAGFSIM